MGRPKKYSKEMRERAVRLVLENEEEHGSQWAAPEHKPGAPRSPERKRPGAQASE